MSSFSILFMFFIVVAGVICDAELRGPDFYEQTCPNLLSNISQIVNQTVSENQRMGASLLRLHFHDCFVNGCDASVLLDDTADMTGEKTAGPNNNSLLGFDVMDTIKTQVEAICPGVVSCADILAIAARDGVVALGGPSWDVPLGRRDSTTANASDANSQIPGPTFDLAALTSSFSSKGFNLTELVILSGGHTIGQARCTTFRARIYNETNIDSAFASSRQGDCPASGGDDNLSPLDSSSTVFNNDYFSDLSSLKGLLHSDQQLFNNGTADDIVSNYVSNPSDFFTDFANAMVKMSSLSPLTGSSGQIRTNCRVAAS